MIVGIGVDVVDIGRFERALARTPGLRARLFTAEEQRLTSTSLAGRFAVKEAVAKVLGAPEGLRWLDVDTVVAAPDGGRSSRPVIVVSGSVAAVAQSLRIDRWHVSISHDGGVAVAMVVAESTVAG